MRHGVWCKELQCESCGCSFFHEICRGRYPGDCPSCRAEPPGGRGVEVVDPDLTTVRDRALELRDHVHRTSLVAAVHRAGRARGIPGQREALLDLSAVALALATRTPATMGAGAGKRAAA
jgi:hypothetical protein